MTKPGFQMITPRNTLRDKIGGKLPPIDTGALARAEAALKSLSGQFQGWMEEEVNKLDAARLSARGQANDDTLSEVYARAHDAKGLGATYEYPLITRIAASLCVMLETPERRAAAVNAMKLIDAHVDAMRAAVRHKIQTADNPTGKALVEELEQRVRDAIAAAD
jgi:hypothetical protein